MQHITIDYGIDLGTTNSAICRVTQGKPELIRTDSGMETMPSCISIKKGGAMQIGQSAYDNLGKDKLKALKKKSSMSSSSFTEFKRSMGSDTIFSNAFMQDGLSPEYLSSEILKTLCSFVLDDDVKAAVITVPAKFTVNQKDATLEAARMAGFSQVELIQEPIAASIAYGLRAEEKNGIWMVFDFGGGTLDVALVNVNGGVLQVFDTEGDNYLGGKNLDEAIVSRILIPRLAESFALPLNDRQYHRLLSEALKTEAEKLKNKLSFRESETIILEAGDWGEDEDGEEIEAAITVTRKELEEAIRPILQKAVDVCKTLMKRNHLSFGQLTHLIPIGGPTYIPLLREMLRTQITENVETGIDPMTTVATGAAIYASTIPIKVSTQAAENDVILLDMEFDTTTTSDNLLIPIMVKEGQISGDIEVRMIRKSDGWESPLVSISETGGLVDVELLPNMANTFRIALSIDSKPVKCSPAEITVIQGTRAGTTILPYNIGIEVFNPKKNREVFSSFCGLEKNRPLPAVGNVWGLKTMTTLMPGDNETIIRIAIYQGDDEAEGKTAALYEYVADAVISGEDIISAIPSGSHMDIELSVNRSEMMNVVVEFPDSGIKVEKQLNTSMRKSAMDSSYISAQIDSTKRRIEELTNDADDIQSIMDIKLRIAELQKECYEASQAKQVEQHLKEILRNIEKMEDASEWDRRKNKLEQACILLNSLALNRDDPGVKTTVERYCSMARKAIELKDMDMAKSLEKEMTDFEYRVCKDEHYRDFLIWTNMDFNRIHWTNKTLAHRLVRQASDILKKDPLAPLSKIETLADQINYLIDRTLTGESVNYHRIDLPSI